MSFACWQGRSCRHMLMMMKWTTYSLFRAVLVAILVVGFAPADVYSKNTPIPSVHGSVIRDYARITFEWPRTVFFTAKTKGKSLTLKFDHKASPDTAKLLSQLNPYVTHVERKADGKTLVVSLDKPYRIRTFVSDNINGVDLLGVDPKVHRKTTLAKARSKLKKNIAEAKPAEKPVDKDEKATQLAKLAPAAGEDEKEAKIAELEEQEMAAATVEPEVATGGDSMPVPPDQLKIAESDSLKVNISATDDSAVLRLPFKERMALAVFVRNRHLWLVFNKAMPIDLSDFDALPRTVIGKAQWIKSVRATVLRMPIDDGVYINLAKEDTTSLDWAILLTSTKHTPDKPVKVIVNTEPPSPAHVFIPLLDAAEPVAVIDPQIGDRMIVTPFYNVDHGLAIQRDFVEFTLLRSAQGLAVVKKADDVTVVPLRNGLRVSVPGGASLTAGLPEVKDSRSSGTSIAVATLFPHDLWKIERSTNPRLFTTALFRRIASSDKPQEANEARLRLAQYYLSEGMAPEALAFLDGIKRTNPSYYRSAKLAALRGAANFLMYRFIDASRDFQSSELNNNKEIDYWRSMLSDLLGNPDQYYNYLALNADYFSKYPPKLRQRMAIVAADRNVAAKEYNTALKIFDSLQEDKQIGAISAYINFLLAKISADAGQDKEAMEIWDRLAADYDQPFVRANAEFARIIWGMDNGVLTKSEGADRLERLRLGWHGDTLELQVLTLLGDIYSEKKDYINAMRVWHGAIQSFPNTSSAITMSRKMQEAFIAMFNEGRSDELPPLEALALYYEYRSYTPSGNTGDELMERLADRLISVDLLSQAASLLEHQMKFQVEKEKRSKVGAKLATIHLLNHKPKRALEALQQSVYGENSLLLKLYRNRLTAEALIVMGKTTKALLTLGQDYSPEAERLRLDVYWSERDWEKIISSVEAVLKEREDPTAPITLDESELLLKLSLAYVFTDDKQQLQYLRDYFSPLMANNPNKEIFDFVTSPEMVLTTRNFDEVVERMTYTRNFIESYSARIQTAGLENSMSKNP